ncbi:MAG: ABC transporter ATP-binding protein [Microgenomates group bacterium]
MAIQDNRLLEIKDLRKSFPIGGGTVEILKGINIKVNKGEFGIIFGPSGCGKSTLLHCLLGLENPSAGTVSMEGQDVYQLTEDQRSLYRRHKVSIIYQQPLWVSSLSVIDNVKFPLHLLDLPEEKIDERAWEILHQVGMDKWAQYVPTTLSSGQQQKISLARALMLDPLMIVADEPTGNLDTVSGQELLQTFMDLVGKGKTVVMVTHDLEYLKYGTKIYHMVDGEVVEEYEPKHTKDELFMGKKGITGNDTSNVRDPKFLEKLHL